jgi:hypothetical protein
MIVTFARVGEAKGIVDPDFRMAFYEFFYILCDCI